MWTIQGPNGTKRTSDREVANYFVQEAVFAAAVRDGAKARGERALRQAWEWAGQRLSVHLGNHAVHVTFKAQEVTA